MNRKVMTRIASSVLGALLLGTLSFPVLAGPEGEKTTFTGVVIPVGGVGTRGTMQFTLYIDAWTTDEERKALAQALIAEGQQGLLKVLRKSKKGRIVIGPRTGYDVNAAVSIPTEKGRRIRVLTERPIAMAELRSGSRSRDYQFGFIEFEIEGDGDGTGQLIGAAQVSVQKNGTIELESYGIQPARLAGVKQR